MAFFDSHAHLTSTPLIEQIDEVMKRADEAEVKNIITIGTDLTYNQKAIDLAHRFPNVYAAVGLHPEDVFAVTDELMTSLQDQAGQDKVVAIGECGLDYVRGPEDHVTQQQLFAAQVTLARELNLPLIIHSRDAFTDLVPILDLSGERKGVLHCFSGTLEQAQHFLDCGWYLGFTGIVTFKNAQSLQEVAARVPLDRMLLETDCPYLAPQPVRGQTNEPAYIPMVAAKIAELRGIPVDEVAEATTANTKKLFGI